MRRLIMWNLVTLDGFFEGPKSWDLDWHEYVWGEELEQLSLEQLHAADMILFGRVTYEGMAAYWSSAEGQAEGQIAELMNTIPKVVFSRTLGKAEWNNTRLVKEPAETEVVNLKKQEGKDILIFGSANLCSTLLQRGLIDECRLGVVPVVLGAGTPLFKPSPDRTKMKLLEARSLKSGCVILRHQPNHDRPA